MDIHRCRFVPYPPSEINVVAFSHSYISGRKSQANLPLLRLAIGRVNGDIEIWNPVNGGWFQETVIKGGKKRCIDGLVWIQDPDHDAGAGNVIRGRLRLFSIGTTTTVTEWDLVKGQPLRYVSGNHGEIWCLTAQPPYNPSQKASSNETFRGQKLVTGCTDGAVVLYSTADSELELERVLVRPSAKKAKIISITFQDRNVVIAGCTDSTIRIFDVRTGTLVRSMSLGAGISRGPREIIVWAVKCLPNGTIVSGDSTGELRLWDGKTYTLLQRIKSHRQDVLSIANSADGTTICSGGMDRRTVIYKQVGPDNTRWAEVSHRRYHHHDVKTMATFEGRNISVIVSGGPDGTPIVLPLKEFGMENQRALPSLPQDLAIQSAPKEKLLMSWWDREVFIWKILKPVEEITDPVNSGDEMPKTPLNQKLVTRIIVKGEEHITSASIAADGRLAAVATALEVKLFSLKPKRIGSLLQVNKLNVPASLSSEGAKLVQISPDGNWLVIVQPDNKLLIGRITYSAGTATLLDTVTKVERLDRKIERREMLGGLGPYERNINKVAFSTNSRILAVSDLAGYIDTWVLQGYEDLDQLPDTLNEDDSDEETADEDEESKVTVIFAQRWARNPFASLLPKLPSAPLVLSFRPDKSTRKEQNSTNAHPTRHNPHPVSQNIPSVEDRLLVITAGPTGVGSKLLEFNVLQGKLSPWSRRNPIAKFPEEFKCLRDQAMGCIWDVKQDRERLWVYGTSWLWMFDLSRDLPAVSKDEDGNDTDSKSLVLGSTNGTNGLDRKRKRQDYRFSGAGSRVPDARNNLGMSRKVVKHDANTNKSTEQSVHRGNRQSDVDTDEEEEEDYTHPSADDVVTRESDATTSKPHWWHTFKYRPMMGIAPLDGVSGDQDDEAEYIGPEVAIVERPAWETDMKARVVGDQEWERPGVDPVLRR